MPFSPISVRQINQPELSGFFNQFLSAYSVSVSGNQSISGEKTFANIIIAQAGFVFTKEYINGDYTATPDDYFLCVNTSGSSKTITFPQSGFITGKEYRIKDFLGLSETNPITLTGSGVTFDYQNKFVISGNYSSLYLVGGSGYNYEIN